MWNYRIIKREVDGQPDQYGLFEVFYNDNGEITAHADEAEVVGDNPEEILESITLMYKDVKKHFSYFYPPEVDEEKILIKSEIKFAPMYDEKDLGEAITLEEFKKTLDKDK